MTERTVKELYLWTKRELAALPVDYPDTEALLLCEHFLGVNGRADLTLRGGDVPSPERAERLELAVGERAARPLQYILGEWEFCGMSLSVGEGVLVPREDTLALVELASKALKGIKKPVVLDLCAGSGAVALGMTRLLPEARLVCLELSEKALPYLERNVKKYGDGRVEIIKADVLRPDELADRFPQHSFDAIVSNPPYIPTADISDLSREVRQEPLMALDGGTDGLDFYRVITSEYRQFLRSGGRLAFELGIDQYEDVNRIFVREGLTDIACKTDFSGIKRAIIGTFIT